MIVASTRAASPDKNVHTRYDVMASGVGRCNDEHVCFPTITFLVTLNMSTWCLITSRQLSRSWLWFAVVSYVLSSLDFCDPEVYRRPSNASSCPKVYEWEMDFALETRSVAPKNSPSNRVGISESYLVSILMSSICTVRSTTSHDTLLST